MIQTETSVRQEIENGCRQFEAAFKRADAQGIADLYTSNGQLLPPGSEPVTGRAAIATFWKGAFDMGIQDARLETLEVERADGLFAEVGRYQMKAAGGQVVDRGKYLVVWKQEGGRLKIHRDIWNTSLAPTQ